MKRIQTPEQLLRARWRTMINRCRNPKATAYKWYGARGITVCDRWADSFDAFKQDMGFPPAGASLDRIDNNGPYEPGNVQWVEPQQQNRNQRRRTYEKGRNYVAEMDDAYDYMFDVD